MKKLVSTLLILLLGLSVACSSSGTTTVQKDAYGNISGQWQMVVDDNGYVSYVWIAFSKPGDVEIDSGSMTCKGASIGSISPSSACLTFNGRSCVFAVFKKSDDCLLLVSAEEDVPNMRLTRTTASAE